MLYVGIRDATVAAAEPQRTIRVLQPAHVSECMCRHRIAYPWCLHCTWDSRGRSAHASPGAATRGATAHQSSDTCAAHVPCTMARIWWHVPLATAPRRHEHAARAPQGVRHKHSLFTMQNLVLNQLPALSLSLEPPSALADLRSPSDLLAFGARNPSSRANLSRLSYCSGLGDAIWIFLHAVAPIFPNTTM